MSMQEVKQCRDIVLVGGQCPVRDCVMSSPTRQCSDAARRVAEEDGATIGFDAAWMTPPSQTPGINIPECRPKHSDIY